MNFISFYYFCDSRGFQPSDFILQSQKVNTNHVVHKRQLPLSLYPTVARGQKKKKRKKGIKRGGEERKKKGKKIHSEEHLQEKKLVIVGVVERGGGVTAGPPGGSTGGRLCAPGPP